MDGFIFLHRKILENPIAQNPTIAWLWITLLLLANHQNHKIIWNKEEITIKRGQLLTGRKQLSQQTGIPETTIERHLDYLAKNGHQIEQQKTNKFRIITILNWDTYQKRTPKRTTNGQQMDTYNKVNKVNNTTTTTQTGDTPPSQLAYLTNIPIQVKDELIARFILSEKELRDKAESLFLYCQSKGRVYKNYHAFLLNALKRDFKEREEPKKSWTLKPQNL